MRRSPLLCLIATVSFSAAVAQAQAGEVIEVLPPKDDGEGEPTPAEEEGQDTDSSSEWDYQESYDVQAGGSGSLQLGLRLGFGLPGGEAIDGSKLSDSLIGQLPIWLDVGFKLSPHFVLGGYAQLGFLLFKSANARGGCPDDVDCSGTDLRFGAQFQYTFAPAAPTRVWLGAGAGYEILRTSVDGDSFSYHGWEFFNGQVGVDFATGPAAAVGPFFAFTSARFDRYSSDFGGQTDSGKITSGSRAFHNWVFLGIRGTTDL